MKGQHRDQGSLPEAQYRGLLPIHLTRIYAVGDNELKSEGSQWAVIAPLGDWRPMAFKGYVELTDDVSMDMSKPIMETDTSEAGPEEE